MYHLTDDQYQLGRYNDREHEDFRAFITATDDAAALEQCSDIDNNVDQKRERMTTSEYQRSVRLWGDWELRHLGGREYDLIQLCGKAGVSYRRFRANGETNAMEQARGFIAAVDRKTAS